MSDSPKTACKLLHVEDNPHWVAWLSRQLKDPPYRLIQARLGAQALALAAKAPPDLVVFDVRIGDMTGHELCRRLRELPNLERLPIVVLSAQADQKTRLLSAWADAFVAKTAGAAAELLATIEAVLRRVRLDAGILARQDLALDPRGNKVFLEGRLVATLTRKQFVFFHAVVKTSPGPLSSAELRDEMAREFGVSQEESSFDTLVSRTRRSLGKILGNRVKGGCRFGWFYIDRAV